MKFQIKWWVWILLIVIVVFIFPKPCEKINEENQKNICAGYKGVFVNSENNISWCYGICLEKYKKANLTINAANATSRYTFPLIDDIRSSFASSALPLAIIFAGIIGLLWIRSIQKRTR